MCVCRGGCAGWERWVCRGGRGGCAEVGEIGVQRWVCRGGCAKVGVPRWER